MGFEGSLLHAVNTHRGLEGGGELWCGRGRVKLRGFLPEAGLACSSERGERWGWGELAVLLCCSNDANGRGGFVPQSWSERSRESESHQARTGPASGLPRPSGGSGLAHEALV